ncbi:MAG: gliding motility protein GldL [Bacteroidota bacterium]|jgi:gliding motility-associated protein GldL
MSKIKKVTGFKKYLHLASCLGAAVVIIGALFKIMHWPGASAALIGGLGTEALLFALFAIDIPHEEVDWTLAYPELVPGMGGHKEEHEESHEPGLTVSQKLDAELANAKIGPDLMESLRESMESLSTNAKQMSDISKASIATNTYVESVEDAAKNVSNLSTSYSKAAESLMSLSISHDVSKDLGEQINSASRNLAALNASYELQLQESKNHLGVTSKFHDGLAELMKNLNDSVDDTRKYRQEMNNLSNNLSALNNIYGNMLTAMNFNRGANS